MPGFASEDQRINEHNLPFIYLPLVECLLANKKYIDAYDCIKKIILYSKDDSYKEMLIIVANVITNQFVSQNQNKEAISFLQDCISFSNDQGLKRLSNSISDKINEPRIYKNAEPLPKPNFLTRFINFFKRIFSAVCSCFVDTYSYGDDNYSVDEVKVDILKAETSSYSRMPSGVLDPSLKGFSVISSEAKVSNEEKHQAPISTLKSKRKII